MNIFQHALVSVAAIGLLLSPTFSNAEGMEHQQGGHYAQSCRGQNHWGHGLEHAVHFLNLSSEQQDKVFQIVHDNETQLYQNHKTIREAHKELRDMTTSNSYDNAKALAISNQMGSAIASNVAIRTQINRQIYELLTPEQKRKLAEMNKKFEEKRGRFGSGN